MREPISGINWKRVVTPALAAVLAGAFVLTGQAQVYTLQDGNSVASVAPNTQAGMFNWTVDGVNQLNQQWFWYGVGNSAPASIDTISPALASQSAANQLTTAYANAAFNVSVSYTLTGGVIGSGSSDIGESIKIVNTTASAMVFHFYQYSDFQLQGVPGPDTVTLSGPPHGGFNDAYQTYGNLALTETVATPSANTGEAELAGVTLAKLNNGVAPVTLSGNPVAAGNVTWALEWDLTIAAGGDALISKDKYLQVTPVPEPSTLALLALGVAAYAVRRRQRG